VPELVSNVCFGGLKRNRRYIGGTTSVYAVLTKVNGAQRP
jgi:gluconolactonase